MKHIWIVPSDTEEMFYKVYNKNMSALHHFQELRQILSNASIIRIFRIIFIKQ